MANHYVYYSYEEFGRGYIGLRSCECAIEDDRYMGSFRDESFNPTQRIILFVSDKRVEAAKVEVVLHDFFDVGVNPHFANQCKQTTEKFDRAGVPNSLSHNQKIGQANRGKQRTPEVIKKRQETRGEYSTGEQHHFYGKTHSEESKEIIKMKRATQTNTPGKGVEWWEHEDGSFRRCKLCPGDGWMLRRERTRLRKKLKRAAGKTKQSNLT